MTSLIQKLEWSGFALLEYLLSKENFNKDFKVLDIGGGWGSHTSIMRSFGLSVDIIDKYNESAEFSCDFLKHNFKSKYDMIICSHVIEHQRNPGIFLDKIYDLLNDDGHLIISGPKHPAERFVEGHISTTILPVLLQMLIYAGFDCKKGKMMSLSGIENSFIVQKCSNFSMDERDENGFRWTQQHRNRSPIVLVAGYEVPAKGLNLHNCEIFKVHIGEIDEKLNAKIGLIFTIPNGYRIKNLKFYINFYKQFCLFDTHKNLLADSTSEWVLFEI